MDFVAGRLQGSDSISPWCIECCKAMIYYKESQATWLNHRSDTGLHRPCHCSAWRTRVKHSKRIWLGTPPIPSWNERGRKRGRQTSLVNILCLCRDKLAAADCACRTEAPISLAIYCGTHKSFSANAGHCQGEVVLKRRTESSASVETSSIQAWSDQLLPEL